MDASIFSAITGLTGAIVGATIKTFAPEIVDVFRRTSKHNKDLLAEWTCEWHVKSGSKIIETLTDSVTIEKITLNKVWVTGISNRFTKYELQGKMSPSNILTLTFHADSLPNMTGVAILSLSWRRNEMLGYWIQNYENRFVGGEVKWVKGKTTPITTLDSPPK